MLDNAFGIFNNVSPRIQWAELDLPFPSGDEYFRLASYEDMLSKNLRPHGKMKIKDAFLLLFSLPQTANTDMAVLRRANLTALDMQMLIHFIYSHLWGSTFNSPVLSLPGSTLPSLTEPFKRAMRHWKSIWDDLRARSEAGEWNKLGYQQTAESYFDAVKAILDVFEKLGGRFPPIPSDCEKGEHLKRLLSF